MMLIGFASSLILNLERSLKPLVLVALLKIFRPHLLHESLFRHIFYFHNIYVSNIFFPSNVMCLFKVINKKSLFILCTCFLYILWLTMTGKKTSVGEGLFNQKSQCRQTLFPQKDFQMNCLKWYYLRTPSNMSPMFKYVFCILFILS